MATKPTFYEGQTATNPQTGEKIVYQKGKWTPVQNAAQLQAAQQAQYVLQQIDRAKDQSGFFNTGLMGSFGILPGSATKKLDATIEPIKANMAFDRLQQMRQNSPTGGAVGNVSDRDLQLLSSVSGALDVGQGETQLDRSLTDIHNQYMQLLGRLGFSLSPDGKLVPSSGGAPAASPAPPPAAAPQGYSGKSRIISVQGQ